MHMTADSAPATRPQRGRPDRPPLVAAALPELRGPASGVIELPPRLFWSAPDHSFDLSLRHDVLAAYESVLIEARTSADLAEFLNGDLLAGVSLAEAVAACRPPPHPGAACRPPPCGQSGH